jgi:hypothetical protein
MSSDIAELVLGVGHEEESIPTVWRAERGRG